MKRKIITINEEKCNGCKLCVNACAEGALQIIDGKAHLISDSYCDGLGACLPECPTGAITIEERDASPFDEALVAEKKSTEQKTLACGCPGTHSKVLERKSHSPVQNFERAESELMQWPCQIKLVPPNAPYFNGAKLLIAADCTAFAYANFHSDFIKGRIAIIGCPKLDNVDYSEKLGQIIAQNDIKDIKVVRMEVPCCGGIVEAVKRSLVQSGKMIPWQVVTISTNGNIID
jgi:ferredoxin